MCVFEMIMGLLDTCTCALWYCRLEYTRNFSRLYI